jgi:hypothetical protein
MNTPLGSEWLDLDLTTAGNGSEVLWAGAFTLAGILGSVALALLVQRSDFRKRSEELHATVRAQATIELNTWRREIAERAMAVISRTVVSTAKGNHGEPYHEIHHAVDEVHALLHLDPDPAGGELGDWLLTKCPELYEMAPHGDQDAYNELSEEANKARAAVMKWAFDPAAAVELENLREAQARLRRHVKHPLWGFWRSTGRR